jgi:hypothetical protein
MRISLASAVLASAALLLAGCGGASSNEGVAHIGATARSGATAGEGAASPASASPEAAALAYSKCMRSNGVPNFPDPTAGGVVHLGVGVDPSSTAFQAADKSCGKLLPKGAKGGAPSPSERAKMQEAALKLSRCMRSHGVRSFPDPSASGGGAKIEEGSGIDPNSPQVRAAQKACQSNGGRGGGGPESRGNAVRIP